MRLLNAVRMWFDLRRRQSWRMAAARKYRKAVNEVISEENRWINNYDCGRSLYDHITGGRLSRRYRVLMVACETIIDEQGEFNQTLVDEAKAMYASTTDIMEGLTR